MQYIKGQNKSVDNVIGNSQLFCWYNNAHLPGVVRSFFGDTKQPIYAVESQNNSVLVPVQKPDNILDTKKYEHIYTPRVISFDWIIYLALGLLILSLFVTMIV